MLFHFFIGGKFRKRIILVIVLFCATLLLFWNQHLFRSEWKISSVYFVDSKKCDVSSNRCFYGTSEYVNYTSDDEIIVAVDQKTGHVWTLGHVRRDAVGEEATLLQNSTASSNGETSQYPNLILEEVQRQVIPSAANRTNGHFLIFNRVPKCASSMYVDILWKLQQHRYNNFKFYSWKSYWERQLTAQKEEEFLEWLTIKKNKKYQYKFPFAMDRHVYFVDGNHYHIDKGRIYETYNI